MTSTATRVFPEPGSAEFTKLGDIFSSFSDIFGDMFGFPGWTGRTQETVERGRPPVRCLHNPGGVCLGHRDRAGDTQRPFPARTAAVPAPERGPRPEVRYLRRQGSGPSPSAPHADLREPAGCQNPASPARDQEHIVRKKHLKVKIPAGVDTGATMPGAG